MEHTTASSSPCPQHIKLSIFYGKTLPLSVHSHYADLVHRHPEQKFRWSRSVDVSQPYKHQEAEPLHCYRTFPHAAAAASRMLKGTSSSKTPSLSSWGYHQPPLWPLLEVPPPKQQVSGCHLAPEKPWMLFCASTPSPNVAPHEMSSSLLEERSSCWPGDTATAS